MAQRVSGVKVSVGFVSETGPRKRNEDFAGAVFGPELPEPRRDLVAAIADGIGSTKGGREAAEIVVRGRIAHVLHVGDTRAYRLSRDRLSLLTTDHVRQGGTGTGRSNILTRAL